MKNISTELRQRFEAQKASKRSALADEVVIGKDILELLTSAMYVDPRTIYREYIQNSADSIDEAFSQELLLHPTSGRIEIRIDTELRSISIRDNGTGIPLSDFQRRLTSFGASKKRGTLARGFRGVGRLAGLGYCQTLIFRSRASQDEPVLEMRWDCRKLKSALLDPAFDGNLSDLVREIVSVSEAASDGAPEHFFEVTLEKVIRIKNDVLLNEAEVARYLSQAAPLPFHPDFEFGREIEETLQEHLSRRNFYVYLQDSDVPLYRPFKNTLMVSEQSSDSFDDVQFIRAHDNDGNLAAIGWILHHGYQGAITGQPEIKGLRARVGDVQVGEHNLFEEIFPEVRFNSWTVGEIHVLDRRITPNGRRDHFEQNTHYSNLINQLLPVGRDVAKRCRNNSVVRNRIKTFTIEEQKVLDRLDIIDQGAIDDRLKDELAKEIGTSLRAMEQSASAELIDADKAGELTERLETLKKKIVRSKKKKESSSPLSHMPPAKREIYEEVFNLIYECANNQVTAKSLVDKILARISVQM